MKIDGQPTNENLNQLVRELTKAAASIPTTSGGVAHGHIGMIIPDAARQVAEHMTELLKFETYGTVKIALRNAIVKCIDEECIKELRSETMGYMHCSPCEINYLYCMGGDLDHMDISELNQELLILKPWDHVEAPATMFARGDKYEHQLVKAGIAAQPAMKLAVAFAAFQASGKCDAAIHNWEAKPVADKTFTNFHPFIQHKFTKCIKHDKTMAKSVRKGIANQACKNKDSPLEAGQAAWALAK
ncbi:hypothetical protein ACHAW6_007697, partial [Cyclotella cf. meneghiniana]